MHILPQQPLEPYCI